MIENEKKIIQFCVDIKSSHMHVIPVIACMGITCVGITCTGITMHVSIPSYPTFPDGRDARGKSGAA